MKYKMWQCVLALVASYMGVAHSWDIAVGVEDQLIFYTINGTKTDTVHFESQNLAALAYDEVHNMMLYVDKQNDNDGDAICGYNLFSMEFKYLTERNGRNIQGLAYDPATEKLFFTDTKEKSINWLSLKPGFKNNVYGNLLLKMHDGIPTDIAVDSCRGYIYWINTKLTEPAIERARFDGSDREVVINSALLTINTTYILEPHSLAIDQQAQTMYWVEPKSSARYKTYTADLNGKNKKIISYFDFQKKDKILNNITNVLSVSQNSLISWAWCQNCPLFVEPKIKNGSSPNTIFILQFEIPVSIVANYKIEQQTQALQNCESLTSLVKDKPVNNWSMKTATEYNGPFCVHGMKVKGHSRCKCEPGYTGERCDVSVCENYCIQGDCTFNDEGHPRCSCIAGYVGERCEVSICHGYCLNDGDCSLNDEDEPVCQCVGNYEGSRCEVDKNNTRTFPNAPTYYSSQKNLTLADLLTKWRKPTARISVTVEV